MSRFKKGLFVTIGFISVGLGFIGVILPILPTTPFLLLASFCFVKGSTRFDTWFKGTSLYKNHLESFVQEKAMTLKQKVTILLFADCMLLFPLILVDNLVMRIGIICLMLCKLCYFTFCIKTISYNK